MLFFSRLGKRKTPKLPIGIKLKEKPEDLKPLETS